VKNMIVNLILIGLSVVVLNKVMLVFPYEQPLKTRIIVICIWLGFIGLIFLFPLLALVIIFGGIFGTLIMVYKTEKNLARKKVI